LGAVAVGLLACAILLANNIRDVDTDRAVGKRTLPVLTGAPAARAMFAGCIAGAFVAVAAVGVVYPPALIALAALPLAVRPVRLVATRRDPPSLVGALVATARLEVVVAVLLSLGLITA
jgi:1,4-dihydroxy-2-naphthoate octaprenyltransferase